MTKAVDLFKFRKGVTKTIKGISAGFHDPVYWISTGNYTLNYLISGNFFRGIPLGKVSMFAGESGSGKSFICSANIVRYAQQQNMQTILIDSENALDENWLQALDVDTSEDKLLRLNIANLDDVAKTLADFLDAYGSDYGDLEYTERPPMLIVVDSLGMLLTPTDNAQFEKGEMKGDMGRKAKMTTALVRNIVNRIAPHPIGIVFTNHTYASQDMFSPDDKISGGMGAIFAASIVVAIRRLNLKLDDNGNKITEIRGIRAVCKVVKSRFSKPFESVKINIPYDSGMDPYSGLFDMFLATGKLTKVGNRYKYITKDGTEMLEFKKNWKGDELMVIMQEFTQDDLYMDNGDEESVSEEEFQADAKRKLEAINAEENS